MEKKALALREFIKRVEDKFGGSVESIVLFGSYARGDYSEDSDIDVLIVGDVDFYEIMEIVTDILLEYGELIRSNIIRARRNPKKERQLYKNYPN
ncbi:nucleotidyltransferase family protein [Thermococcus chitonophagus]|uniref:Polymerase nucleotidyl transferase domain-containing protein n=1 Tax=Thermococcus chitonophagus TaxID=54262 RepID=A0A160VRT0_9EURY|nr:nucleotidyltransferase domain-containing protein [Thermococcus chitonophagus]CUX77667.1 hypothetical protein CHITON_0888 [Thermococcus chitonophagus]